MVVDDNTIVEEEARDAFLRQDDTIRVYSVTTDGNYRYMHVRTGSEVYLEQYENILKVTSDAHGTNVGTNVTGTTHRNSSPYLHLSPLFPSPGGRVGP